MTFASLSRLSLLTLRLAIFKMGRTIFTIHMTLLTFYMTIKLIALFLLFLNIPTAEIGLITDLDILVG